MVVFRAKSWVEIAKAEWDELIHSSSMGYAFHMYDFLASDEDDRAECLAFGIVSDTGKLLMAVPLFAREFEGTGGSGSKKHTLILRRGFAVRDTSDLTHRTALSKFFCAIIEGLMEDYGVKSIVTELPALAKCSYPGTLQCVNPLIFYGFSPLVRYTWVVDLRKSHAEILQACAAGTKREIRRCKRSGEYVVEEVTQPDEKCVETLIALSAETYGRSGLNAKGDRFYRHFVMAVPRGIRRIYYVRARCDERPIVAAGVLVFRNTARYHLAASVSDKPAGVGKFLIYRIMLDLKEQGIELFETGGAYPHLRKLCKRKGMSDFKSRFGSFLSIVYAGLFAANQEEESGFSGTGAFKGQLEDWEDIRSARKH